MAKLSKETASDVRQFGPVTDRRGEMDGVGLIPLKLAPVAHFPRPLMVANIPVNLVTSGVYD